MSTLQINRNTLEKLNHDSMEIRLRTLEQVVAKLDRALTLNEKVEFKASDLCKQLIRWFGFRPIQVPTKVLNLLKSIIQSPQYGVKAIEKLGSERLIKELNKVQKLLEGKNEELKIINEIKHFLRGQQQRATDLPKIRKESINEDFDELIKSCGTLNIDADSGYSSEDYEIPWSRPSPSDYTSMKFLADILINPFASPLEIQNAVQHLQLTLIDYPPEYLLQAPHIFRNLLNIYDERKRGENQQCPVDCISYTLLEFLLLLEKSFKAMKKTLAFPFISHTTHQHTILNSQTPCQLKVDRVLTQLLDASLYHLELYSYQEDVSPAVWEVIFKVLQLFEERHKTVDVLCLYRVASVVAKLATKFAETEHCARLRLHQMQLIFLLQDIAQINGKEHKLETIELLEPILRDYSLKCLFPQRHQQLQEILLEADKVLREKYQILESYEKSFQASIHMLIASPSSSLSCKDIIEQGYTICRVLDKLQSKHLVDILFNGIIQAIPLYPGNAQLKSHAVDLLLQLLNLTFMPLKSYVYEKLTMTFKKHIGCLMNGECYTLECSNSCLLEHHIVGVPLNYSLLSQIVHDSFESSNENIQQNCFKLLELLLQSQSLFGSQWCSLWPLLFPLMPLLICCSMSKKLLDLQLKLYDPDLRQLPYVSVLQGNLGFLFHNNAAYRSEALTRLIYTINSLVDSEKYMPNLVEISDTLPNDLCILAAPRDYRNIFNDHSPLRSDVVTSLNNLIHLLESPDVEPLIRKTTLMQINVLCSNWHITGELCNSGASFLILQALENSLQRSSCSDYTDSVIPVISILNKILLYDSSVRCELAETPNIYVLLLRALMLYHNDIQVRQDATMCLFQLLFAPQLIVTESFIEAPFLLGNIQMPLSINLRSAISQKIYQEPEKLTLMFSSALEETQYWRLVIADVSCGGLDIVTQKSTTRQLQLDVKEDLKLTCQDVRFIRATQPGVSLHRLLRAASNATDHASLVKACLLLKQQLLLPRLKNVLNITNELCSDLNTILVKYLQLPPGNKNDLELYEHLIDVSILSIKIPLSPIVEGFFKILQKDPRHAFVTMLTTETEEIPLRLYYKITSLLKLLFKQNRAELESKLSASDCCTLYSQLFDLFVEHCLQLFAKRDLLRVRCLLHLLVALSACNLDMPDQYLFFYCRRFTQLSLGLKTYTQTGAQWHRDCLLAILQLSNQMQNANDNFRLPAGCIKYLSGLCGHNDVHVRVLAWSILNVVAKTTEIKSSQITERKSSDKSGAELLLNELAYLPGGFMACCLSSLLDSEEVICIRQLAGQLLATLISKQKDVEAIEKLLEQNKFLRSATESLKSSECILSEKFPHDFDPSSMSGSITTCDLVNCYSRICIEVSIISPAYLNELCTHAFMFKLYEIMKLPPPDSKHKAYVKMTANICLLYAMCNSDNFAFLQRTICRDAVWLSNFCQILFQSVAAGQQETSVLVDMLQLLMVLCKDSTALEQLATQMLDYSTEIVELFNQSLTITNLNTSLQRCLLSVLSLLLMKSQPDKDTEQSINILTLFETQNVLTKISVQNKIEKTKSNNKENNKNNGNVRNKQTISDREDHTKEKSTVKSSVSEHICIALIRLFTHLYPIKVCKFTTPVTANQQQVTETLALLLKQSPVAQETAHSLKFHDKIINIFKCFFEEFATTSCTTYVKRHGENKKMVVIKNLQLMFKLILSWHSSPAMMITDESLAIELTNIIIQIWPWLAHSGELKLTVLQVCAFLSERSLVICKKFSTLNKSSFPHSVLQLVTKVTMAETMKIKAASTDSSPVISAGLRVLMNCCSCVEGRNVLLRARTLDIFDGLHPFNPKAPQLKSEVIIAWLQFWELYSRYNEGAPSHHLNSLCSVINKTEPGSTKRLLSLRILRNMTLLNSNRSSLITSTDFIYTVNEIVKSQTFNSEASDCSLEELYLVCVALWKLISGGIKFVAMIRGTKLAKNLRVLQENLTSTLDENVKSVEYGKDLLNVLDNIFKMFEN